MQTFLQPWLPLAFCSLAIVGLVLTGCKPSEGASAQSVVPVAAAGEAEDDPEAVYQQASQLLKKTDQPAALAFGLAMMRIAADAGHTRAQSITGFHLAQGENKDLPSAVAYLCKAAVAGDKFAAQNLRRLHDKFLDEAPEQKPVALAALQKASEQGSVPAAGELGSMYYFGSSGLSRDYGLALPLLRQAAEGGDADAANTLGVMYTEAIGVPEDDAKGFEFFTQAAQAGHAKAQASLGMAYVKGHGVARDPVQAYVWLRLSALAGEASGQNALADFIRGLSKDQIRQGHRQVAEFLRTRGEKITPEKLDEEIFNPKLPTPEQMMPGGTPTSPQPPDDDQA